MSPVVIAQSKAAAQHLGAALGCTHAESGALHRALLRDCQVPVVESPAEAVFLAWWRALTGWYTAAPVEIEAQTPVVVDDRRYRLDFTFVVAGLRTTVAVEIDGRDFHERTPEQVTYRDQRDRALAAAGWRVLHFSYAELVAAPHLVVDEVFTAVTEAWATTTLPCPPTPALVAEEPPF